MEKLFKKLHLFGGAIVRECDVSPSEKQKAVQEESVFTDGEGLVFLWVGKRTSGGIGWGQ